MTFYDFRGEAVAYLYDDIHIYLFSGEPVAYLHDDAIYGYNGHQLGWFEEGWIRDLGGRCVFFTENTNGSGPVKPVKHVKPVKSVRYVKPVKSARCAKYAKAVKSLSWSSMSGRAFFIQ